MVAKDRQNATDSPKAEVGEIDTRAPFQSVKDAVSLFGEGAFSGERRGARKIKPHSADRVLAKETQLHLAQKELNKLREQLTNAEATKSQALDELEKARKTVKDLNCKLATIGESKALAIKAAEESQNNAKQLVETKFSRSDSMSGFRTEDLESSKMNYLAAVSELDDAKQELRKLRQDCDVSLETKMAALKQADEAEDTAKENMDRSLELSKEILVTRESLERAKLAVAQAQEEHAKIFADKDVQKQLYKSKFEDSATKLLALKQELNPSLTKDLATQVVSVDNEIKHLQLDMEKANASELESVRMVTSELVNAKDYLQKVAEEESSLRGSLESLKLELENVKKEHAEMKEKEAEMEYIAGNLNIQLCKTKSELEACIAEESKARDAADDMVSTFQQLSIETEKARIEAEEMKLKAELLKKEAETTRAALAEAESKLRVALQEAEEAKLAEARVLDQIKALSERTTAARSSTSDSGTNITISKDEYDSLSQKVVESDTLANMKVAAALAQVEAVKASENEALKKLESTQKEIEDMRAAAAQALKKAEMAEAAKRAVEGELRKWREREKKKAAEAASRILAQADIPALSSPIHFRAQKQNPPERIVEVKKLETRPSSVSKKTLLPNLSGIFQKKKSHIDGGSPSYLPGEKPI
uniref:WEB family protein n=1 Tax=Kalanchoe fedtschenkoi TaxID=63787 RepID=A0A7N0RC97_KALFE